MPGSSLIRETIALPEARSTLDFLGVNYYGRFKTKITLSPPYVQINEGPGPKSDLGWEIYPEGLYTSLRKLWKKYERPILVSENGLADEKDSLRAKFLTEHIEALQKAQRDKVTVLGYLHWSLTDNFEWAFGLKPRFGLVEVDYSTGARKARPSFEVYKELISRSLKTRE